ncbi:MAG: hypothetical protein ACFFB3_07345 [Candidatus Hodarchaeota archaeon]
MIDEVFVLNEGGIPIFHYDRLNTEGEDDRYLSISSFLSAMSSFANEMAADEIKFVVMKNRSFALSKTPELLLLIFSQVGPAEAIDLADTEIKLLNTSKKVREYILTNYPRGTIAMTPEQMDQIAQGVSAFLKEENVIGEDFVLEKDYSRKQRRIMQGFLSRTVGYKPGVCNIGEKERMVRLMSGFAFLFVAFLLWLALIFLENNYGIPREARLLILPIPLFFGFQGFYQYFFRFCVTNALRRKYVMK